jgi:hypothetical protein
LGTIATVKQDRFPTNMNAKWHFMTPGMIQNPSEIGLPDEAGIFRDRLF